MSRSSQIIRTSVIGIAANVLLAAFKSVVGIIAGSVAIVMDAVNNLSDALSSVITIIGTKLSQRPADRKHPFGFGRIEYFSAIIIAVIVLSAGISSLIESVKKIIEPTHPSYTTATLIVIVVAIAVKLVLGFYVKRKGKQLSSDALVASGSDALFDAIITTATLGHADMERVKMILSLGQRESTSLTRDGFVRPMPMTIELKRFVMENYDDGAPKRFASACRLNDSGHTAKY